MARVDEHTNRLSESRSSSAAGGTTAEGLSLSGRVRRASATEFLVRCRRQSGWVAAVPVIARKSSRLLLTGALVLAAGHAGGGLGLAQGTGGPPAQPDLVPVRVEIDVTDSQGDPATEALRLVLNFPSARGRYSVGQASSSAGRYVFNTYVERATVAAHDVAPELWLDGPRVSPLGESQFFMSPADGRAAFLAPGPLASDSSAASFVYTASAVLSAPPLYGQVSFSGHTAGARLMLVDALRDSDVDRHMLAARDFAVSVPGGGGSVPVYRWSRSGASLLEVRSQNGVIVGSGRLRRGGQVSVDCALELQIDVGVSGKAWPDAFKVLVVAPGHHSPNPELPSGSNVGYRAQKDRAIASSLVRFVDGVSSGAVFLTSQDCVVELWQRVIPATGPVTYRLLSHQPVAAGSQSVSASF